jgi:antitoxin (DNA-binding transcriptional repressor) of toxin-antitoxin stability system
MKNVRLSELRERLDEVIDAVKNGEPVSLVEGESTVAEMKPLPKP